MHATRFNQVGVPERYEHYIGVGTDRRLIVIEAKAELSLVATSARLKPTAGPATREKEARRRQGPPAP